MPDEYNQNADSVMSNSDAKSSQTPIVKPFGPPGNRQHQQSKRVPVAALGIARQVPFSDQMFQKKTPNPCRRVSTGQSLS